MKVTYELDLERFEAWSGGKSSLDDIIERDLVDEVTSYLEDIFPDGASETDINDWLWFEFDDAFPEEETEEEETEE